MLEAHGRRLSAAAARPRLLVAGAGGVLGGEVTRRLIGAGAWQPVTVLTREPLQVALKGMRTLDVAPWGDAPSAWPVGESLADVAVVMFEPPRPYHQRERALWTPTPAQLPALAHWLYAVGVRELAVLMPHAAGRLPEALKHGLADLNEAAVAQIDFSSLLWLRTAEAPRRGPPLSPPQRLAAWMLGIFKYMVPDAQRPLRAERLAVVAEAALRLAPRGVHVVAPELLRAAAQGDARQVLGAVWGGAERASAERGTMPATPPTS